MIVTSNYATNALPCVQQPIAEAMLALMEELAESNIRANLKRIGRCMHLLATVIRSLSKPQRQKLVTLLVKLLLGSHVSNKLVAEPAPASPVLPTRLRLASVAVSSADSGATPVKHPPQHPPTTAGVSAVIAIGIRLWVLEGEASLRFLVLRLEDPYHARWQTGLQFSFRFASGLAMAELPPAADSMEEVRTEEPPEGNVASGFLSVCLRTPDSNPRNLVRIAGPISDRPFRTESLRRQPPEKEEMAPEAPSDIVTSTVADDWDSATRKHLMATAFPRFV
ncbi:unnamed protein product [Symbiodinium sp. KB8]|nr:unnamed protein product [Symbiodinium sp. KB8]